MTGEELLHMFGLLRGIPVDYLGTVVQDMIVNLDLTKHAKKLCETYR